MGSSDGIEEYDDMPADKFEEIEWDRHYGTRSKRWRMKEMDASRDETNQIDYTRE